MKTSNLCIAGLSLLFAVMGASPAVKKRNNSVVQFGECTISRTGILSVEGQSAQYLLVSRDKYPAQLKGIAIVDLAEKVYVARFFEPGGTGVQGFFDVCFQIKQKRSFSNPN